MPIFSGITWSKKLVVFAPKSFHDKLSIKNPKLVARPAESELSVDLKFERESNRAKWHSLKDSSGSCWFSFHSITRNHGFVTIRSSPDWPEPINLGSVVFPCAHGPVVSLFAIYKFKNELLSLTECQVFTVHSHVKHVIRTTVVNRIVVNRMPTLQLIQSSGL